jgi:Zn-dependent peptidase ImmA (M78 family)
MKSDSKYNSKKRLLEVFQKVNKIKLNEDLLNPKDKFPLIAEFVAYACNRIDLSENDLPEIIISENDGEARENKSFGGYNIKDETIRVILINRNLADVLRTLAHELVHHKQKIENKLDQDSGKTGSDCENEANSLAGVIMREFGKIRPEIFE